MCKQDKNMKYDQKMIFYKIQSKYQMKGLAQRYPKEKAAPIARPSAKLWKASPSTTQKLDITSDASLRCYLLRTYLSPTIRAEDGIEDSM